MMRNSSDVLNTSPLDHSVTRLDCSNAATSAAEPTTSLNNGNNVSAATEPPSQPPANLDPPTTGHVPLLPPPPYTPRPIVSETGSPMTSTYVDVSIDLRWPDTNRMQVVKRGTKQKDLERLTPVKQLAAFSSDPTVIVSPPESAKTATRIHVDANYEKLVRSITDEVEKTLDEKNQKRVERLHDRLKEELKSEFEEMVQYEKDFTRYLWMRIIQDCVYMRMAHALSPGSDSKDWDSFDDLVSAYVSTFKVSVLTESDLHHLRNSTHRNIANDLIHPRLFDLDGIRRSWNGLDARLRGDGLEELRSEYGRYFTFATENNL